MKIIVYTTEELLKFTDPHQVVWFGVDIMFFIFRTQDNHLDQSEFVNPVSSVDSVGLSVYHVNLFVRLTKVI